MIFCCCFIDLLDTGLLVFMFFCVIFLLVMSCSYLHAYYGQPAAMALAFRQPSIDISAMCLLFVGSVVVNEILLLLD